MRVLLVSLCLFVQSLVAGVHYPEEGYFSSKLNKEAKIYIALRSLHWHVPEFDMDEFDNHKINLIGAGQIGFSKNKIATPLDEPFFYLITTLSSVKKESKIGHIIAMRQERLNAISDFETQIPSDEELESSDDETENELKKITSSLTPEDIEQFDINFDQNAILSCVPMKDYFVEKQVYSLDGNGELCVKGYIRENIKKEKMFSDDNGASEGYFYTELFKKVGREIINPKRILSLAKLCSEGGGLKKMAINLSEILPDEIKEKYKGTCSVNTDLEFKRKTSKQRPDQCIECPSNSRSSDEYNVKWQEIIKLFQNKEPRTVEH
jgi:hypothetical protein